MLDRAVEFVDPESGHTFVRCELNTFDLKAVTIDTYGTFPIGFDRFEEGEIEWLEETYTGKDELNSDDFSWKYDNGLWRKMLSDTLIEYLMGEQPREWIKSIEFVETTSPKEYNFRTDQMYANFTVNVTKLRKWWALADFTFESEMAPGGRHGSYDGYHSFIRSRYAADRLGMETMMMVDRWIESWSIWGKFTYFMEDNMTGNGEAGDCIDYWPGTNSGLLAWVEAGRDVDDRVIADFAAREVNVEDLQVGDRLVTEYGFVRFVEELDHVESSGGERYVRMRYPYDDGSGGTASYFGYGAKFHRSFVAERDLSA